MKQSIVLMSLFFLMIGCIERSTVKEREIIKDIEFTLIGRGNLLGNGSEDIEAGSLWVSNEIVWKDLLEKINVHHRISDSFIDKDIDFKVFDVVATFDEVRAHTGFNISIIKVVEDSNNRIVYVELKEKNSGYRAAAQPYYLIKIPKSEKTVMFQ